MGPFLEYRIFVLIRQLFISYIGWTFDRILSPLEGYS